MGSIEVMQMAVDAMEIVWDRLEAVLCNFTKQLQRANLAREEVLHIQTIENLIKDTLDSCSAARQRFLMISLKSSL